MLQKGKGIKTDRCGMRNYAYSLWSGEGVEVDKEESMK